jgi:Fe-Mn family superoxide dismutase
MAFELPELPYSTNALEPYISAETLEYHYGKHHRAYVTNLNQLAPATEFVAESLETIIQQAPKGPLFNNAAQVWNHSFYWNCLKPKGGGHPTGSLATQLQSTFGDFTAFQKKFTESALKNFGSGWTWLVQTDAGELKIIDTSNADCPLTRGEKPLLTVDVWEHAYYIDYRNARPDYLNAFWSLVNWDFVDQRLDS